MRREPIATEDEVLAVSEVSASSRVPLILDLDGTLIATDLLAETMLLFLKRNPLRLFVIFVWILRGRAHLKQRLSEATELDVELLPVREDVAQYARACAEAGTPVYICTAAHEALAERLTSRFEFISGVIGSDGKLNLKGPHKAKALTAQFPDGFIYAGDSAADLAVWRVAAGSVFAGGSTGVRRRLHAMGPPIEVISPRRASLRDWVKALRVHQYAKNALIFVPLLLGGAALKPHAWVACGLGFLGMGVLASGTYVLNDLFDLFDDRRHWSKRRRAFASGLLPIPVGLALVPLCLVVGLALGYVARGPAAVFMFLVYLAATLSYSFGLKRIPVLDVVVLAGLFTLRLAIGVVCAQVAWSPWLLVFSMFVFSSLSSAKRATEIAGMKARAGERLSGRGYVAADEPVVLSLGVALATAAVLVLVLYLIDEAFLAHFYRTPGFLWGLPVGLALWMSRIWLLCGRGELHDDPVAFAIRDKISLALGGLLGLFVIAAVLV